MGRKSIWFGLLFGACALAVTLRLSWLFTPSASVWMRMAEAAGFALATPGLLASMLISGNVHAFHLWPAALVNFVFWFTFGWCCGVLTERIRILWSALHSR